MQKRIIYILLIIVVYSCNTQETYYSNLTKLLKTDCQVNPSSVIIHNDTVYGHTDSTVVKLDLKNGTKEWEYTNPGTYLISKPLIVNNQVYFASRNILQKME